MMHEEEMRLMRLNEIISAAADDEGLDPRALSFGTAPGDRRKLRGLPAVGVGGAIPGGHTGNPTASERECAIVMQQRRTP